MKLCGFITTPIAWNFFGALMGYFVTSCWIIFATNFHWIKLQKWSNKCRWILFGNWATGQKEWAFFKTFSIPTTKYIHLRSHWTNLKTDPASNIMQWNLLYSNTARWQSTIVKDLCAMCHFNAKLILGWSCAWCLSFWTLHRNQFARWICPCWMLFVGSLVLLERVQRKYVNKMQKKKWFNCFKR